MNVIGFEPACRRFRGDRTESRRPRLAFRLLTEPASAPSALTVPPSALIVPASALTLSVINEPIVARAVGIVGRDIRVPLVVLPKSAQMPTPFPGPIFLRSRGAAIRSRLRPRSRIKKSTSKNPLDHHPVSHHARSLRPLTWRRCRRAVAPCRQ
jgi:hypothetical protein